LRINFKNIAFDEVDEDVLSRAYWTGKTRAGCVGQFTSCLREEGSESESESVEVISNSMGGACVAVAAAATGLLAKSVPCDKKLFLACQGRSQTLSLPLIVWITFSVQHFFKSQMLRTT